jgi:hypothetical protein
LDDEDYDQTEEMMPMSSRGGLQSQESYQGLIDAVSVQAQIDSPKED